MPRDTEMRTGMALAAVLYALVILGLLASASFFVAMQEMRSGLAALSVQQALAAAESAAESTVGHWNDGAYGSMGVGDSVTVKRTPSRGLPRVSVTISRTGEVYYLVRCEGLVDVARQQVAILVRLNAIPCASPSDTSCSFTSTYLRSEKATQLVERGWVSGF